MEARRIVFRVRLGIVLRIIFSRFDQASEASVRSLALDRSACGFAAHRGLTVLFEKEIGEQLQAAPQGPCLPLRVRGVQLTRGTHCEALVV